MDDQTNADENAGGEDDDEPGETDGSAPGTQTQQTGEQAPTNMAANTDGGGQDLYPADLANAAQGKPYLTVAAANGGGAAMKVRFFLGDVASPRPADHRSFYYAGGVNSLEEDLPASWKENESFFNAATTGGLVPSYATMRVSRAHPDIFDPEEILTYNHAVYMEVDRPAAGVREFKTKQYRVVVSELSAPDEGFKLEYYHRKPTNRFDPLDTAVTKTVTVSNPTPGFYRFVDVHSVWKDGASNNQQRYIRYDLPTAKSETPPAIGMLEAGLSVRKTVYFTPPTGALTAQGDGPREEIAFLDTVDGAFVKTVWLPSLNTTPASHYIASQELLRHRYFGGVKRLVAHTRGYNTDQPLTTRYGYMSTPGNVDTHGRLHFVHHPDGRWQVHKYSTSVGIVQSNGNEFVLPGEGETPEVTTLLYERIYEPIGNQPFTTDFPEEGEELNNYRLTTLTSPDKSSISEVVTIGGTVVSSEERKYYHLEGIYSPFTGEYVTTTQAPPGHNQPTISILRLQQRITEAGRTTIATFGSVANSPDAGRLAWKKFPDGTAEVYSYVNDHDGVTGRYKVTKTRGAYTTTTDITDTPDITSGTTEITVFNAAGVAQEQQISESGKLLSSWEATEFDAQGRPTRIIENGDVDHPRLREYGCCGLLSETSPNGVETITTKDKLKRTSSVRVVSGDWNLETTYTIYGGQTANGDPTIITEVVRSGYLTEASGTTTEILLSKTVRHVNGLVLESWTADEDGDSNLEKTTIDTQYGVDGFGKVTTTTDSLQGTRVVTTYCDGRTYSVKGTAVADIKYDYSPRTVRSIRLQYDGNGDEIVSEWTEDLYDTAGRKTRTSFSSPSVFTSYSYYTSGYNGNQVHHADRAFAGSWGRLQSVTDPDGVVTSYTYNSEGEHETISRAIPGHAGSQDTKTTTAAVTRDGYNGLETTTEVIGAGDMVGVVASKSFRSGDGMYSRQESFPNDASTSLVTTTKRIYSATKGEWTEKITSPTTFTRRTYKDGLLNSVELKEADDDSLDNLTSTTYTYDLLGRVKTTNHSRTGVTTYSGVASTGYTPSGNLLGMKDAGSRLTQYAYDQLGRRIQVDAPDTEDPSGTPDNTDFDNITHTSYYPTGQVKATWGDGVYPRFYQYDEQNRMTTLRTWQDASSLDLSDGLSTAEANASATSTWSYNPTRGWLDYKRDADGKGADYTYTDAGRLETRQWARTLPNSATRLTTTYGYDEGQLTSVTYNDSTANGGYETPDLAYTYTKFGQLDKIYRGSDLTVLNSAELHADYGYDPVTFQVTSEELYQDTSVSRTLTRHYDDLLRPQSLVLGSDHKVGYGYDTAGRLNRVWHNPSLTAGVPQGSADFIYGYEDDSYGLIEEVAGPVHTVTNTWEGDRNVLDTKSNVKNTGSVTVSEYDYTVNDIGQRTRVDRTGSAFPVSTAPFVSWSYDSLGQVRSAGWDSAYESNDERYRYDSIGNRVTSFTGPEEPEDLDEYVANGVNEYTSTPFERTTSYDNDGNMTSGVVPGETGAAGTEYEDEDNPDFAAATDLTWDAENRLVSITVGGETFFYDYDYLGRRIVRSRSSDNLEMHFYYDGWNLIAQRNLTSVGLETLARTYTWGLDLSGSTQGAGGVGGLLTVGFRNGSNVMQDDYYPVYDGNGNICQYLDSSGNTDARYEYDSFGRIVVNEGNNGLNQWLRFRFSTKHRDYNTGLYYYGYRYYDPVTGRWPSRDPIEEYGGINLYNFISNSGLDRWDFLGFCEGERCAGSDRNTMRGSISVVQFVIDNVRLTNTLQDLKDQKPGTVADIIKQFNDRKIRGVGFFRLDFEIGGELEVTIKCERCTCCWDAEPIYWYWWEMSPVVKKVSVPKFEFPVLLRASPGIIGKLKLLQNALGAANSVDDIEIDWATVFELSERVNQDLGEFFEKAVEGTAEFSQSQLDRICDEHWDSTTETPD
ncbi:RHS repeat domain-containing protein [Roseibacillus persicicus]|uniref:RHS repeat-associated core domain-containing protein n=1 Tax=Roseibacillus persicicus TaxID=454148 RepID=A0A918TAU4_9BACT|nr:RHS repeat protein [Roseibacillus persicicus]GHC40165.1 hypothetical protein GCM10007100_00630 [Roseibacillus persicicus]